MAHRIMRKFRLNEISAVDNPAQQGAKALITKRHTAPDLATASPELLLAAVKKHKAELRFDAAVRKHKAELAAELKVDHAP